jgi:hypothetical protein
MIDDQSPAGSCARTLHDTRKDIRFLSDKELLDPFILDKVMLWNGCETRGEARDIVGAEMRRRTLTNGYGDNLKGQGNGSQD